TSRIGGKGVRHVVDYSNAHRNTSENCYGEHNVTDFLTHFNSCKYNKFINCNSTLPETQAYSFTPASGDKYNSIIGGTVEGVLINAEIDESIRIDGVTIINSGNNFTGKAIFNACSFVFGAGQSTSFMRHASGSLKASFINCTFLV